MTKIEVTSKAYMVLGGYFISEFNSELRHSQLSSRQPHSAKSEITPDEVLRIAYKQINDAFAQK